MRRRGRHGRRRDLLAPRRRRGGGRIAGGNVAWVKGSAVLVVVVMNGLNVAGSTIVAWVQSLVVVILAVFAAVTIANVDRSLLAPSGYRIRRRQTPLTATLPPLSGARTWH